jgi:vacuolar iron transporter family protein
MRSSPESKPEEPEALTAHESGSTEQPPLNTHLASERRRIERLSRVRQLVFGSLDGLLVPLGVISGVAAGTNSTTAVVIAGVAEAFAGALSMGAGEFISSRSEAQTQRTQIEQELRRVRSQPDEELREMVEMFQRDGVEEQDANTIAMILARHPNAFETTMVEKELGLQLELRTVPFPEALTMGSSYIAGSIFPLVPYFFFPVAQALPISIALTAMALVVVGVIKGRLAGLNLLWSALEVVVVGAVSAGGGYLLGTIIPRLFGY